MGSGDVTERIVAMERLSKRVTAPVHPIERLVLPICEALEECPEGCPEGCAGAFDTSGRLPTHYLEMVLGRFALAEALGADWGIRKGPLQFDALFVWPREDDNLVLRVLASRGRLLVLAQEDRRERVPASEPRWPLPASPVLVLDALRKAERFSLDWVAAAQTQCALERLARRHA